MLFPISTACAPISRIVRLLVKICAFPRNNTPLIIILFMMIAVH
ncbi:hypothetical protein BSM4216_2015 [Bacillus smithii]|nr:hypothetical protein BSM4216_2015 [Bacillus smithii]